MNNNINRILLLVLIVLAVLVGMHYLPNFTIAGHTFRNVDILSDVRPRHVPENVVPIVEDTAAVIDTSSVVPAKVVPQVVELIPYVDTCKAGVTCIEDFSDSTCRGMQPFYLALDNSDVRPVRVAYFGDSFIEGDIFTADLRQLLQQQYGGHGVGYVPINTASSSARVSVRQEANGWNSHSVMTPKHFDHKRQDIANRYFTTSGDATFKLETQKRFYSRLDRCQQSSFFFRADSAVHITVYVNDELSEDRMCEASGLQAINVSGDITSVQYNVIAGDTASTFFGATMDDSVGIALDNFAMRGASGVNLRTIPESTMADFYRIRPYDLVVLQFGLNVASQDMVDYSSYVSGMRKVINHIKNCFPGAGILIVSVADRDYKTDDGDIVTMPGIKALVTYQKNLAVEENVAFWNMFQAMGGEGSMKQLVEATPPMANHDYTHINSRGGKHMAQMLFDALQYGKELFDEGRAQWAH